MKNIYIKNTITYTIFLCVVTSSSYADTASQSYNDSSTSTSLENAEQLELDKGDWLGLNSSDQGAIYHDSSTNTVNTDADLTIDYSSATSPKFVIGGYNNGVSGVEVINNIVTIAKGTIDGNVYGGLSHYTQKMSDDISSTGGANSSISVSDTQLTTNKNKVVIEDDASLIMGSVYGGNSVLSLTAGNIPGGIYTNTNTLSADDNTVSISNNANITGSVYGGNSVLSLTTGNTGSSSVYSGSNTLSADGNFVSIGNNANITGSVYGSHSVLSLTTGYASAFSSTNANASSSMLSVDGNTVSIGYDTNIAGSVYGGSSVLSLITGNSLSSGYAYTAVYAMSNTLSADGNTVSIGKNATIIGSLYGGNSVLSLTSGNASSTASADASTSVSIDTSKLFADSNTVTIGDNSKIFGNVYGGYSALSLTTGDASVFIPSTNSAAISALASIVDVKLSANDNTVIFDGNLTGEDRAIYGGRVEFGVYTGTETTSGTSTIAKGEFYNTNSLAQAIDNTITISQNATFNDTASLYGGYLFYNTDNNYAPKSYDFFSGNTLHYASASASFKTIGNFENYYFYLNENNKSAVITGTALITVKDEFINSDTAADDGNGSIQKTANVSNIQLSGISKSGIMNKGQSVTLLDVTEATLTQDSFSGTVSLHSLFNTPTNNTVKVGLIKQADISYTVNPNTIVASIEDIRIDKENLNYNVKPLAEGRLAGLENVVRGADLLMDIIQSDNKPIDTFTPIAVINGGFHSYKSGSHIDTRDYRVIVGSRYQFLDNFFVGLTAEYGRSNYDTYNNFSAGRVNGDGHTYNYGVSLFSKLTMPTSGGNEFYIDDGLRLGRTNTEFKTGDIVTGSGDIAYYKSKVKYYGVNVGAGYIYNLDDTSRFDSSIRYLWTRLGSDSIVIDGDKVNFEISNSSKIQLKEKYSYKQNAHLMLSLAGIYEYEFDSKAKTKTNFSDISIDIPSAKGSTGIMEIEVKGTPVENNQDLTLNVNFKGYAGKREGVSVAAFVEYDF